MAEPKKTAPARLMDLSVFIVALDTFDTWRGVQGQDSLEVPYKDSSELESAHMRKGLALLKKRQIELRDGINQHLYPLADIDIRGAKTIIRQHRKVQTNLISRVSDTSAFLSKVYQWADRRGQVSKKLFRGGKVRQALRSLAQASAEGDYAARVHKLATIAPLSGLTAGRTWMKEAAKLMGAGLTELEAVRVDVEVAQDLGEKIKRAKQKAILAEPNSPEAIDAEQEVASLGELVEHTAQASQNPDAIRLVSAQASIVEEYIQVTKMGAQIGLSRPQERAMLVMGKAIIAAGAGAGKTRVLAGKVVHHIRDEGVPLSSLIATSFSSKSAAELKRRINNYGVEVPEGTKNIGTTHSVGNSILDEFDPLKAGPKKEIIQGGDHSRLISMAMSQVRMSLPSQTPRMDPDPEESIFPKIKARHGDEGPIEKEEGHPDPGWTGYWKAIRSAKSYYQWLVENNYGNIPRTLTDIRDAFGWKGAGDILFNLNKMEAEGLTPDQLEDSKVELLNIIFSGKGYMGQAIKYRIASTSWDMAARFYEGRLAVEKNAKIRNLLKMASEDIEFQDALKTAAADGGTPSQVDSKKWHRIPAKQWFNLGWPLYKVTGADQYGQVKQQKIGPRRFGTAFGRLIGDMKSPGQSWAKEIRGQAFNGGVPYQDPRGGYLESEEPVPFEAMVAAVYGAYVWLKREALEFRGRMDFSDQLIRPTALMIHNPKVLKTLKDRYSHILVDEAQDLNQAQHALFGLIAGYVNPKTLKPYRDKRMNAEAYVLIGDDKQSIFAFRGADPEVFIERSDLGPEKGDFTTVLLETNYRSGGMIVGAANNLIAHNVLEDPLTGEKTELQIKMTCDVLHSSVNKGYIEAIATADKKEAAELCASAIEGMLESGEYDLGANGEEPTFGIALRTNQAAYNYCIALAKKKIPFRSSVDIFGNITTAAILRYMNLASSDNKRDLNDAVLECHRQPNRGLPRSFQKDVKRMAKGNYYDWILENWRSIPAGVGRRPRNPDALDKWEWVESKNRERIGDYVAELEHIRTNMANLSPDDFLEEIMQLQGQDSNFNPTTFEESLMEYIRQNDHEMDSLAVEGLDDEGNVPDEAIRDKAMAPVDLIRSITEEHGDIGNAMVYINKLQKLSSKSQKEDKNGKNNDPAVLVATMHSWKGLECEHLYTQMSHGEFPSAYATDDMAMAQERRLAYVALTRGKESVTVYAPLVVDKNGLPMPDSPFIGEACIPGLEGDWEQEPGGRKLAHDNLETEWWTKI